MDLDERALFKELISIEVLLGVDPNENPDL